MAKINEAQKWPSDKARYDKNYLRLFGKLCPACGGSGRSGALKKWVRCCSKCDGIGYVEKDKWD